MPNRDDEVASEVAQMLLTGSVIIPTYNRPDHLRQCLLHVRRQTTTPIEVIVVDSSEGDDSRTVVEQEFPEVRYLRNPAGRGTLPEARNIGVGYVTADVVAFLDDDANARPDWLAQILPRYRDQTVGGVGGAALNGIPGEREQGLGSVGRLLPDGRLIGNFAADTGHDIEVDHLLGANMTYRRTAVLAIGGIHGGYPGTCLREDSDIALRVRKQGYRLVFAPDAIVEHVPGPYAKGERFDRRYTYFAHRNHIVLLARIYGPSSPILRRYLVTASREFGAELKRVVRVPVEWRASGPRIALRGGAGGATRAAVLGAGIVAGFPAAVVQMRRDKVLDRSNASTAQ